MPDIRWQEWSKQAFERSKAEQKPILLDIFGSWCHWCHVMEETSYADPAVVDLVNKNFVPVRVDTDKRPDVNRRYNMGGWPSTVFLDSEGKVITGGTYIPPPQLREVLRSVTDLYQRSRGRIKSRLGRVNPPTPSGEDLTAKLIRDIATNIAVSFDIDYGGFGFEPKFPHTDALELAMTRYHCNDEKEMLTVVSRTLDKMGKGGVYDQVEGGFFRYSTTRDWSIPHFEKMLEDNAKLLRVYLHAFQITRNPLYREISEGIIRYADKYLTDKNRSGFYGSQDADEKYYALSLQDRAQHEAPEIDRTIYTNYNALMVSSYFLASTVLERPALMETATRVLDKLLETSLEEDGSLAHYDQEDAPRGLLIDHALLINALLDAYTYTLKRSYLEIGIKLADFLLSKLQDPEAGGFYDIPETGSDIGELRIRDKPLDENSLAATALLRLSHVTSEDRFSDAAAKTLKLYPAEFERYGLMAASYGIALDNLLNGTVAITIIGSMNGIELEEFRKEALNVYDARRSILYLSPEEDSARIRQLGYETAKTGHVAYVCVGRVCGPPLKQADKIGESVESLVKTSSSPVTTTSR